METLLPLAEKLMTSADSRLAASSKLMRVRVESSKKRLTTVRPRSVGSFLTSRPASAGVDLRGGVEHERRVGAVQVGRLEQVPLHCGLPLGHEHLVDAVDLGEVDLHLLAARGRHVLADEVGPDRQLAVAAVDEDGELDRAGPAEVAQRVERRAHRAAGVEDVVDEHDEPVVDAGVGQHRGLQRADAAQPQVVAVERDVDGADVDRRAGERLDAGGEPPGERGAAGRDADEDEVGETAVR